MNLKWAKILHIYIIGMAIGFVLVFVGFGIIENPIMFCIIGIPATFINVIIADKLFGEGYRT